MQSRLSVFSWVVLTSAVLCFAFLSVPRLTYSFCDTETVPLALFYQDVVVQHHNPADWQWGGFSGLFPDVSVYSALNFITGHSWAALQGTMIFFFLAWIAGAVLLTRAMGRSGALPTAGLALALVINARGWFRTCDLQIQDPFFQPLYHAGTGVMALASLAVLIAICRKGATPGRLVAMGALVFLAGVSDVLYLIVFGLASLCVLASMAAFFPSNWKRYSTTAALIAVTGAVSFKLAHFLFPVPLDVGKYTGINLTSGWTDLGVIWSSLRWSENPAYVVVLVGDALFIATAIATLSVLRFTAARRLATPTLILGLSYGLALIMGAWSTVLLVGIYGGMYENRYVALALVFPWIFAVVALDGAFCWPCWLEAALVLAISGVVAAGAFHDDGPSGYYATAKQDAPFLRQVMKADHIQYGMADYWQSNLMTVVSNGTVVLRTVNPDGAMNHWFNSLGWFGKGAAEKAAPRFRLFWSPCPRLAIAFGKPDQILRAPSGSEVWVYSEARAIHYQEATRRLVNALP